MRVISLFSGSSGNCTLVDAGEKKFLVDAGGSARAVCDALAKAGYDLLQISDIFITHEHGDHTHALPVLIKKHPVKVHMTEKTADALCIEEGSALSYCVVRHGSEYICNLGDCTVEAFTVPHDSACCVGYKVTQGSMSVGIATDLGYATQRVYDCLCGCEAVMLEANHDREMVKRGGYPASLKRRILSGGGHLSNDDCAELAAALARQGMKSVLLAHISQENNTEKTALDTVKKSVEPYGVIVCAASSEDITVLV